MHEVSDKLEDRLVEEGWRSQRSLLTFNLLLL